MASKERRKSRDMPKTWSSDDGAKATNPPATSEDNKSRRKPDEGIRPEDLTSENDQGAG